MSGILLIHDRFRQKIKYNAYGELISKTVEGGSGGADNNPFMYRGYYYDKETGLYYLQSRYYDPKTYSFISPDSFDYLAPEQLAGVDLYAYCAYNPVMRTDRQGTNWWDDFCDWCNDTFDAICILTNYALKATVNFVAENWDIIVGAYLVAAGIALSIVTFGATTVVAGVVCGAVLGAAFGALSAYSMGENVIMGLLTGMTVGATGGISPYAAMATAAGMSLISDKVNGKKAGWDSLFRAGISAVAAAVLSKGGDRFSRLIIDNSEEILLKGTASFVSGFIFSGYSFVTDAIFDFFRRKYQ